ncbi:MAG: hypothetical protein MR616_03770, partial [Pyramidobacter sp.]|nr:hypothetical protein [Pyramidobacter sp.]
VIDKYEKQCYPLFNESLRLKKEFEMNGFEKLVALFLTLLKSPFDFGVTELSQVMWRGCNVLLFPLERGNWRSLKIMVGLR